MCVNVYVYIYIHIHIHTHMAWVLEVSAWDFGWLRCKFWAFGFRVLGDTLWASQKLEQGLGFKACGFRS